MLSPEQEAKLRAAALDEGVDPDALVAAALADVDDDAPAVAGRDGPAPELKIFQYHIPFMRVRELRRYLQLTERIPNDDMLCGQFLERFGGALAGPQKAAAAPEAGAPPLE